MKSVLLSLLRKGSAFFNSLNFRQAILISIGFHVVLFLAVSVIFLSLQAPYFHQPPLIFDFVFAPAEEVEEQEEASPEAVEKVEPKTPKPVEPLLRDLATRPAEQAASASGEKVPSAVEPAEDGPESLQNAEATATQPFRVVPKKVEPLAFRPNSFEMSDDEIVSAKMSMSRKQHKMLRKKFKKWAENFHEMELPDSTLSWEHKDKLYEARFRHLPAKTATDVDELVVEIETEEDGYAVKTEMRMKRLAFSSFAQFVDSWHPWVAVHDDKLDGRFHSNTEINVSSSYDITPKFLGKVTTASYDVKRGGDWPFFDDEAVFQGGLETGVKTIHLPKNFLPFMADSSISQEQVLTLKEDTRLVFQADGSLSWHQIEGSAELRKRQLPADAFYILADQKSKLYVRGVVRGQVLIYSPGKIIIEDDLTYARLPGVSSNADDYLGLVSDKDIEIAHPDVTGPGDLHIHAAVYAKKTFRVKHRHAKKGGTLYLYGSLTAGTLTATEPRYATHIRFDKRLEQKRPPNFPITDRYEVSEWDGKWEIKGDKDSVTNNH